MPELRPVQPAVPAHAWTPCGPDELSARLREGGWTLIEFWSPDVLYCRLLEPVRVKLPQSHGARLRLLFCPVLNWLGGGWPEGTALGVTALPALVLFHGARRVRRWLGAVDASVVMYHIDTVLADAAP